MGDAGGGMWEAQGGERVPSSKLYESEEFFFYQGGKSDEQIGVPVTE